MLEFAPDTGLVGGYNLVPSLVLENCNASISTQLCATSVPALEPERYPVCLVHVTCTCSDMSDKNVISIGRNGELLYRVNISGVIDLNMSPDEHGLAISCADNCAIDGAVVMASTVISADQSNFVSWKKW